MEQPFQCTQCTAKFPYQSSLLIHRARTHLHAGNVQNSSQLKSGDSRTPSKQVTKNSIPLLNPRKRKMVQKEETMKKSSCLKKNATTCIFCEKAFELRFVFENHMSTHTLERPYECSQCQANFGVHSALYSHQKVHHGKKSQLGSRRRRRSTVTKRVIPQELPKASEEKDRGTSVEKEIENINKFASEHIAEIKLHKMSIKLERIQLPYKCQTVTDEPETVKQSMEDCETEENTDDKGNIVNEMEMELSLPIAESQVDPINAPDEKPEVVAEAEGDFAESELEVAVPESESIKTEESPVSVYSIPSDCVVNTKKYDMISDKDVNFESPVKNIESSVGTEVSYPCLFCRMSFRQKHRLTNHIGGNHRLSLAVALKNFGTGYRGRNFM